MSGKRTKLITSFGKILFPEAIWQMPNDDNKVYLTFDDGPHPEITLEVLNILEKYKAKATFFCVGKNVTQHPLIFEAILKQNHAIGNHTYNHLKGWKTSLLAYARDIQKSKLITPSKLFRPPYGKITKSQYNYLKKEFKIIMWDTLAYDFDYKISAETCLTNCTKNLKPGNIIVLHDSEKAYKNMIYTLPRLLDKISEQNLIAEKLVI